ncbi:MAG: ATP synthase F1 subunit epsilon [Candidatus Kerfeldbacteria bacterium]|nr:ATP synthase F1 subunit epsilon [Candidatus Kerfeldbacteria bacterium]
MSNESISNLVCEVVTPERTLYSSDVAQVTLPTVHGEITVLPHHIALVGLLAPGELRIVPKQGSDVYMAVSGGFIEVAKNRIHVLADTAERSDEIDEQRAEAARQRAQQLMSEVQHDEEARATALGQLEKELARLRVVRKHRGSGKTDVVHEPVLKE